MVPQLNPDQVELIRLLLAGKTTEEIAIILKTTPRAVRARLYRIALRARVTGRDLIAAYAICHQIISIEEARSLIQQRPPDPDPYR